MPLNVPRWVLVALSIFVVAGTLAAILLGIFTRTKDEASQAASDADFGLKALSAMNLAAKPCDDFYEYACGAWLKSTKIPADRTQILRSFSAVDEDNAVRLRQIIAVDAQDERHPNAIAGRFQRACVKHHRKGPLNASLPVLRVLRVALNDVQNASTLASTIGKLRDVGISPLFGVSVMADLKRPERHAVYLSQSGLGLPVPAAYTANGTDAAALRAAYCALYATNVRAAMDARLLPVQNATEMAAQAFELELNLSLLHKPQVELLNLSAIYRPTPLASFPPTMHVRRYLAAAGVNETALNGTIIYTDPAYVAGVARLMARADSDADHRAALRAYMAHLIVSHLGSLGALGAELYDAQFNFSTLLSGVTKPRPRWRVCQDLTTAGLGEAVGEAFVARHFNASKRAAAQAMTARVTESFRKSIISRSWMDEGTRRRALAKLDAMLTKVGHPKTFDDYPGLVVTRHSYAQNVVNVIKYRMRKELRKLGTAVDKDEWFLNAFAVNAYYAPTANEIVFPAGILQPPFFSDAYPDAMNYGAIGMVIGHEISHGFDDQGRTFTGNGSLVDWWSPAASAAFKEKAECFVDQFSRYKPAGTNMSVNGNLTLGENIADAGGLEVAFDAFKGVENNSDPRGRPRNPALAAKFTNHQLFFVAYAQMWCAKQRPKALRQHLVSKPHSPPRFRVLGPLSQSKAFADTFNCPLGSTYNPMDKCKIWR